MVATVYRLRVQGVDGGFRYINVEADSKDAATRIALQQYSMAQVVRSTTYHAGICGART